MSITLLCLALFALSPPPITFGVHPYLPRAELESRFRPLAVYLSAELGRPVELQIASDYNEHIEFIGADKLDLAFVGPAVLLAIFERYGPKPLLARLEIHGEARFRGVLFTRRDRAEIKDISALKGRSVAFGSRRSTMSYLIPLYMLHQGGVSLSDLSHHQFLRSHTNVVYGVLAGDFDAGAVKEEVFSKFQDHLKPVEWTPLISEHAFLSKRGNDPLSRKIRTALMKLNDSSYGSIALKRIKPSITGLAPVKITDYDNLKVILSYLNRENLL